MNLYIEWAAMRWLKEHGTDVNAALVRKALAECDDPPAVAVEREPESGRLTFEPVPQPYTCHIKPLDENTPPSAAESNQPEATIICLICGGAIKPDQTIGTIGYKIGDFGRSSFVVHHAEMLDCNRSLRERMDSK